MTKIVYTAAPPDVYLPPRGVEVRPLEEHPAFTWLDEKESLPTGEKQGQGVQAQVVISYLSTHPPATIYEIMEATGATFAQLRGVLYRGRSMFRVVEKRIVNGHLQSLWGLGETPQVVVKSKGREVSQRICAYLQAHGTATIPTLAQALNLDPQKIKNVVHHNPRLFRKVARVKGDKPSVRWVLWGLMTEL